MKRARLTLEEHREASKLIAALRCAESALFHKINGRVPLALMDRLLRIDRVIMQGKSDLEDLMYKQLRGDRRLSTDVYYPGSERETTA